MAPRDAACLPGKRKSRAARAGSAGSSAALSLCGLVRTPGLVPDPGAHDHTNTAWRRAQRGWMASRAAHEPPLQYTGRRRRSSRAQALHESPLHARERWGWRWWVAATHRRYPTGREWRLQDGIADLVAVQTTAPQGIAQGRKGTCRAPRGPCAYQLAVFSPPPPAALTVPLEEGQRM